MYWQLTWIDVYYLRTKSPLLIPPPRGLDRQPGAYGEFSACVPGSGEATAPLLTELPLIHPSCMVILCDLPRSDQGHSSCGSMLTLSSQGLFMPSQRRGGILG